MGKSIASVFNEIREYFTHTNAFTLVFGASIGLIAGFFPLSSCAAAASTRPSITEERLGDLTNVPVRTTVSPDGLHVAYVTIGVSQQVILDGKPGPAYKSINSPGFSPDGRRFWYFATKDASSKRMLVVDGVEWPEIEIGDFGYTPYVQVSPDGRHIGYYERTQDNLLAIVDGKAVVAGPRSLNGWVLFSPDLSRFACLVREADGEGKWLFEGKELPGTLSVYFSPDGKHAAYRVGPEGKQSIVFDGKQGQDFNTTSPVSFSPDSGRWAYIGRFTNGQYVVVDGIAGDRQQYILSNEVLFSPDSKHWACIAKTGDQWVVLLDDVAQSPTCGANFSMPEFRFSPDSSTFAYQIEKSDRSLAWVVGGKEMPWKNVGQFVFSPDSKRLAYSTLQDGKRVMVVDDQPGPTFPWIGTVTHPIGHGMGSAGGDDGFQFSPDSRHFAYVGLEGNMMEPKAVMVLDHKPGLEYSGISKFTFSPDSAHLAYVANTGRDRQVVVLDRQESRPYTQIIRGGPTFSADGTLEFLGIREGGLYRIRIKPGGN